MRTRFVMRASIGFLLVVTVRTAAADPIRIRQSATTSGPAGVSIGDCCTATANSLSSDQIFSRDFSLVGVDLGSPDTLAVDVAAEIVQPVSSFTVRLFDRGDLLGTFSRSAPLDPNRPGPIVITTAFFVAAGSSLTPRVNPTTIDFSAFRSRTFDGRFEFSISDGLLNVLNWDVFVGNSQPDGTATGRFVASSAPVPEPGTLLLLLGGLAAFGRTRRWHQRAD
jgi:PEP-CTERM motif-containing protein